MSWPHVLSFSRVLAAPVVAALILAAPGDAYGVAAVLFTLATITDLLDGKLARYSEQVSPLGVFLDTTADKVLVSLALVAIALAHLSQGWIPLTIIGREFLISGLRSYAASRNQIISAHIWGKGKTALTMIAIISLLFAADGRDGGLLHLIGPHSWWAALVTVSQWLLALSAVTTIVSGGRYIMDAMPLFRTEPEMTEQHHEPRSRAAGGR